MCIRDRDVDVYKEIINQLGYIPGEKNKFVQSYSNLIYAMGEGNGADSVSYTHLILMI